MSAALVVRVDAMPEPAPLPSPAPAGGARPGRASFAGVLVVAACVAYTRRVTQVWCVFFAANAVVSAATALWADAAGWALYNGLIAYVAMGLLMAGEWLVRRRVRARAAKRARGAIDG